MVYGLFRRSILIARKAKSSWKEALERYHRMEDRSLLYGLKENRLIYGSAASMERTSVVSQKHQQSSIYLAGRLMANGSPLGVLWIGRLSLLSTPMGLSKHSFPRLKQAPESCTGRL